MAEGYCGVVVKTTLQDTTSGIPGGYRLVSTYDLPDCKTILKFEIWSFSDFGGGGYSETLGLGLSDNFHWGGILKVLNLDSLTIFILGGILKLSDLDSDNFHFGGYSETLGLGLSDNFHFGFWGGILKLSDLDCLTIFILGRYSETLWQFSFLEGILKFSDLDSLTIFILGGILKLSDLDSLTIFIWGEWEGEEGGGRGRGYSVLQNRGYSPWFWTKISTTPAGSCITDSLSHTTYVETKYRDFLFLQRKV